MKICKGFQFKLNPTPKHEALFWQYCGAVRWVWNQMLAQRNECYQSDLKSPTTIEQIKQLPILKQHEATAWLKTIHSQVLQNAVLDLDDAFTRCFNKHCRKPRFKRKHGRKHSFSYPQDVKVDRDRVWLPKIGWICFRKSREIEGVIKRATIRHKASGWYVSLVCEVQLPDTQPIPATLANSIGIDLGSIDLVASSRGDKISNPRNFRSDERKLRREQRRLSRKKSGSKNYIKQRQKIALLHERISNRRKDCLHKISHRQVSENQAIFAEDLNVLGIAKRMGKSVGDAGWTELVRQLKYKSEWTGKTFLQIGRYSPSSNKCSSCGYIHHDLLLSERSWLCPSCEVLHDRDTNAAINIHREGLGLLAAGHADRINACGERVRPAQRARLSEARISR